MRRLSSHSLILSLPLGLLLAAIVQGRSAHARASQASAPDVAVRTRYVCVPSLVWRNPELCPGYGPGTTAHRVNTVRLPDPLPQLPIVDPVTQEEPEEDDLNRILPLTYGHVISLPLNVYRHPMEAAAGLPPVRAMLSGDWWLSIEGMVEFEGQKWLRINEDEYVPAEVVSIASPSRFQGVLLAEQPQYPFAWINRWVEPSTVPQGSGSGASLARYELVTIFSQERRGEELWYLVGPDQWVEQSNTSRVDVDPPPEGVGPADKWIEVDLFEQTIAAYEGPRMVFATLMSGGREGSETPPGLYRLWVKIREGKMSNPDAEDGDPAFYFIEDVPWTIYFHEGYSIHTSFWHDAFGFRRSHGCVNLSPHDAYWIYHWSDPPVPEGEDEWLALDGMPNTWVWVHFRSPLTDARSLEAPES